EPSSEVRFSEVRASAARPTADMARNLRRDGSRELGVGMGSAGGLKSRNLSREPPAWEFREAPLPDGHSSCFQFPSVDALDQEPDRHRQPRYHHWQNEEVGCVSRSENNRQV